MITYTALLIMLFATMVAIRALENNYERCCDASHLSFFYHRFEGSIGALHYLILSVVIFTVWRMSQFHHVAERIFGGGVWFMIILSSSFLLVGGLVMLLEKLSPNNIIRSNPIASLFRLKDFLSERKREIQANKLDSFCSAVIGLLVILVGVCLLYETAISAYNNFILSN